MRSTTGRATSSSTQASKSKSAVLPRALLRFSSVLSGAGVGNREAFTEEDLSALTAEYESTMLGVLGFKPDKKWMAKRARKKDTTAKGEELAAFGIKV